MKRWNSYTTAFSRIPLKSYGVLELCDKWYNLVSDMLNSAGFICTSICLDTLPIIPNCGRFIFEIDFYQTITFVVKGFSGLRIHQLTSFYAFSSPVLSTILVVIGVVLAGSTSPERRLGWPRRIRGRETSFLLRLLFPFLNDVFNEFLLIPVMGNVAVVYSSSLVRSILWS